MELQPGEMMCNSLKATCTEEATGYCRRCSHAYWYGEGEGPDGVTYRWLFNPRFGPEFVDEDQEPFDVQPMSASYPGWVPFNRWYAQWKQEGE